MSENHPDPPVEPLPESTTWFESGPEGILADPALACLIVRLGMASNALNSQQLAGVNSVHGPEALRKRDVLQALVSSAAITSEAVKLVHTGMKKLKPLAREAGASPDLLSRIGKLCAGKHSAARILNRARNQLAFHWDAEVIQASVMEYSKNKTIIWLEFAEGGQPIHRLAFDVLAHGFLPREVTDAKSASVAQKELAAVFAAITDATRTLTEFSIACTYGFIRQREADRKTR